jgi:hypothetical protein
MTAYISVMSTDVLQGGHTGESSQQQAAAAGIKKHQQQQQQGVQTLATGGAAGRHVRSDTAGDEGVCMSSSRGSIVLALVVLLNDS